MTNFTVISDGIGQSSFRFWCKKVFYETMSDQTQENVSLILEIVEIDINLLGAIKLREAFHQPLIYVYLSLFS